MGISRLFKREEKEKTTHSPVRAEAPKPAAGSGETVYRYCSFCGQKYPAGTKHYCSVNDLIKYDLK